MTAKAAPGGVTVGTIKKNMEITAAKQVWQGAPKIGKTSTAAALGTVAKKYKLDIRPFFMLFEPGSEGVDCDCTSRKCERCAGTGMVSKKKCPVCNGDKNTRLILSTRKETREWFEWYATSEYNIAVIDTGDRFYQMIMDDVCTEMGIVSPYGANDNGISWAVIFDEMRELLGILEASGKGVILIHHVYLQEKRGKGGATIQQRVFNVPGKAKGYIAGFADQHLHFDVVPGDDDKDKHIIIGQHQSDVEAGDRWGLFPAELDLGSSPEEAAEAILTTFGYLE
jgi:hypothetical protein